MKVLLVFGTRPEAIKMAPLVHAARLDGSLELRVCTTGQHEELVQQALRFFEIQPDYRLSVMRPNQDLAGLTARILESLRPVLLKERPDALLVQGDTTSCFAAALAAFYESIPVGHVEAGLRTNDLSAPFPEEGMRQLVSRLAALHFAPTERNRAALLREGIPSQNVFVTGNTVVDAVRWTRSRVLRATDSGGTSALDAKTANRVYAARQLLLVTGHRRENFGDGLKTICGALLELAQGHADLLIAYSVHPNPNVHGPVKDFLSSCANIVLLPPLDYPEFVALMDRSCLIISDSGGIQEEAAALQKRMLVTRDVTERPEAVESGYVELVGTDRKRIVQAAERILNQAKTDGRAKLHAPNPYGDGHAGKRILEITATAARCGQLSRAARDLNVSASVA